MPVYPAYYATRRENANANGTFGAPMSREMLDEHILWDRERKLAEFGPDPLD